MKKIILIFLLQYNFSICQIINGEVEYTIYFRYTDEDLPGQNFKVIYQKLIENSGKTHFSLNFNLNESIFENSKDLNSNSKFNNIVLGFAKYPSPIYHNYIEKLFFYNNGSSFIFFQPKLYVINKEVISNWILTSESKLINNKRCFKAISSDYSYVNNNKKTFEVEAWYCPEIPVKHGPLYFNNLPGLILEVNYDKVSLLATKVNLNIDKILKINKPTGSQKVTFDEYNILLNRKIEDLQTQMENEK